VTDTYVVTATAVGTDTSVETATSIETGTAVETGFLLINIGRYHYSFGCTENKDNVK
jgi:predicted thioesterase